MSLLHSSFSSPVLIFSPETQTVKQHSTLQHSIPNTNTLQLFLEECPRTTNNRLVCRISDELLTHDCGSQPLSQRPRPRVISKNRRIVTPSNCQHVFGKTSSHPVGHNERFATNWPSPTTVSMRLASCLVWNCSQVPLRATSRKLGHQQGLFFRWFSTQLPLFFVYHCCKFQRAHDLRFVISGWCWSTYKRGNCDSGTKKKCPILVTSYPEQEREGGVQPVWQHVWAHLHRPQCQESVQKQWLFAEECVHATTLVCACGYRHLLLCILDQESHD